MSAKPAPVAVHEDHLLAPHWAQITEVKGEAEGISTFWLEFTEDAIARDFRFLPGQFNMVYLPGYGEAAISLSSDPAEPARLGHTIRFVGNVTRAISRMRTGSLVGLRGPFGSSWPLQSVKGKDLVLATGGIGMAPLRPVVYHLLKNRGDYGRVVLLYGARTPKDLLYTDEFEAWQAGDVELHVTVDRADQDWRGQVGVVPMLFYRLQLDPKETAVFSCGPEIMMRFVVYEALARRIQPEHIYLSLERNMKCGQGFCGHCQLGPLFICRDGPVYDFRTLEPYFQVEDF